MTFEAKDSAVFKFQNLVVNLVDVSAAPRFIGSTTVASREAGSRFLLVIQLDDMDVASSELERRVILLDGR